MGMNVIFIKREKISGNFDIVSVNMGLKKKVSYLFRRTSTVNITSL